MINGPMAAPALDALAASLLAAIEAAQAGDLPVLAGLCERGRFACWARLAGAARRDAPQGPPAAEAWESVDDAARRTGLSKSWFYKHAETLPFTRKVGSRVLCSVRGLEKWLQRQRPGS